MRLQKTAQTRQSADERRYYREWSMLAFLSMATLMLMLVMHWGQSFGFIVHDQFQRWWPAAPSKDIVIVAVDDHTLESRGAWPIKRTAYADLLRMLADSGNSPQAIGFDILFPDPMTQDDALAEQMLRHRVFLSVEQSRNAVSGVDPDRQVSPVLAKAAQGLAHVNLSYEKDGALRGTQLVDRGLPQLALAMSGLSAAAFESHNSYRRFHMVHPKTGFPMASLVDVLAGQVPLDFFKGKYLLVGATAPSLGDHFPTLYSGQEEVGTPGVVLHANLLSNLLQQQLIEPVPMWQQLALSGLSLSGVLLAMLVLSPLAELLANLIIAIVTLLASFAMLTISHRWFDPGLCIIAMAFIKPAWAWRRNEMIVSFMAERAAILEHGQRQRKTLHRGLRLRHFASDTLMQYSRMLDKAIGLTHDQLGFLQRLVAQVPVAMLVADTQDRILMTNPGMQENLPKASLHNGGSLNDLLNHLGLRSQSLELLTKKDHLVTLPEPRGAGKKHFILRVAPIHDGDSKPLWVLSLSDVTEMRQFQAQRDRTLQLLSHDMRTPIAAIIALTRQNQGERNGASEGILRHASTLLGMMDDFIFSIQAEASEYRRCETLIDDLVDEATYQVKDLAKVKGMPLVAEIVGEPQFVRVDPRLMSRVLINLLVNAVRYGQAGTDIRIKVSVDGSLAKHRYAVCRISNTVADQPSHKIESGSSFGLGMEFVQTVVHKHEGLLKWQFSNGPGSAAFVELALPLLD